MMIHEITVQVGKYKTRKRIGRGHGSGSGKTAGRGHKGARSRAGYSRRPGFEGGQMSFVRRMPKRGFTNAPFRTHYHIVNVQDLEARCDDGAEITVETLAAIGLVRDASLPLKVLGHGDLTKKFKVTAAKFSASAKSKIEGVGGTVTEKVKVKWKRTPGKKKAAAPTPAPVAETSGDDQSE
jgi:large subunit ribosomal protein L15